MIKNKNVRKRKDILPISTSSYQSSKSKKKSSLKFDNKLIAIIEFGIIILLLIGVIYYRSSLVESDNTLQLLYNRYNEEQQKIKHQENKISQLQEIYGDMDAGEMPQHDKDKNEWNQNDQNWIKDIQNNDFKSLRLQYGDQPIRVLIETDFGNIVLQLAPIDSMPHTIRYFLTLVENKFWTGCHFFRNAHHVIQANCHKRNAENIEGRGDDMISLGQSASIVFQEYDDTLDFLHEAYSIGLAGRPGGPDFYINLVDNKRNHGPGGQGPKPDPCFASIISGREVVDKIHELEHDGSAMMVLKEWVEFKKIYVIQNE